MFNLIMFHLCMVFSIVAFGICDIPLVIIDLILGAANLFAYYFM